MEKNIEKDNSQMIDLPDVSTSAFLAYRGFDYKTTLKNGRVVFQFKFSPELQECLAEEFPKSEIYKFIAIVRTLKGLIYGLKK